MKLGIRHERIEPGKPQQNGRHERMLLTLKGETSDPPCGSMRAQQRAFDRFRQDYARSKRKLPKDYWGSRYVYDLYDGWETARVLPTGRISCDQRSAFISIVFRTKLAGSFEEMGNEFSHLQPSFS